MTSLSRRSVLREFLRSPLVQPDGVRRSSSNSALVPGRQPIGSARHLGATASFTSGDPERTATFSDPAMSWLRTGIWKSRGCMAAVCAAAGCVRADLARNRL